MHSFFCRTRWPGGLRAQSAPTPIIIINLSMYVYIYIYIQYRLMYLCMYNN